MSDGMDMVVSSSFKSTLDTLLNKLVHPLLDTRIRAAKNLTFKIKNGLIGELSGNSVLYQCVIGSVIKSLNMSKDTLGDGNTTPLERRKIDFQLQQLLDMVYQLSLIPLDCLNNLSMKELVLTLQSLMACENVGRALQSQSQKVRVR